MALTCAASSPSCKNATIARARGFPVEDGFFPQDLADRGPYDIIAFNDVFEHLPDPARVLQAVEQLLRPGGIAVLNLPTSDGFLYNAAALLDRIGLATSLRAAMAEGASLASRQLFQRAQSLPPRARTYAV